MCNFFLFFQRKHDGVYGLTAGDTFTIEDTYQVFTLIQFFRQYHTYLSEVGLFLINSHENLIFNIFLYFEGSYAKRERNSSSTHARSFGIHDLERTLEPKVGCFKPQKLFCEVS